MEQEISLITKYLARCPLCDGSIRKTYGGLRDRFDTTSEYFDIFTCLECGIHFTNPLPRGNLGILYPSLYLSSSRDPEFKKSTSAGLERWYRENQYAFDFSLFEKASGVAIRGMRSYLDIGCGTGERINYVRERGCEKVFGIDSFECFNVELDKEKYFRATETLLFNPQEKYHVVSLFHVLEHIINPSDVIDHIASNILEDGGYLILQVPNYHCIERSIFRERWFCFDVPRHLWHFTPSFLHNLLDQRSWRVLRVYQSNSTLHPVSLVPSIHKDLDIQRIWIQANRNPGVYWSLMKFLWILLTLCSVPSNVLQSLFNRASMLTVVARNATR